MLQGTRVLIIDDDADLVRLLTRAFTKEGAEVRSAGNGRDGLRTLYACHPHLVILDIMMPVMNGWQTLDRIREMSDVPVILLTVRRTEEEVIRGLETGAVDYVTKPFSRDVLLARARAALQRAQAYADSPELAVYDDGHLRIDTRGREVTVGGETVALTDTEYRLLTYLYERAGRVVTHQQILSHVWGAGFRDSTQYLHAYLWRLRQKLEPAPSQPVYLTTMHGVGYRFIRQPPE